MSKHSGIDITRLPRRYQDQIGAHFHNSVTIENPAAPMIRQNRAGLNKTEQAFLEYLKAMYPEAFVLSQSVTLKLANGVRYTPDFVVKRPHAEHLIAYEVKGFMRDDAAVKIKVAARAYPWINFILASRRKNKGWNLEGVLF